MRQDPVDAVVLGGGPSGLGKVTPPSLHRVHANERLFGRLDAAFERPVVWIQGQPGAGKTTLVASYLAARRIEPLWYRLDEGDADPATLFFYLAEAARRTSKAGARNLPLLTPEHRSALPLLARRFFRGIYEGGPPVLVFDDYHEVTAGAPLHDLLPHALEETPQGRNVVIVSRGAPPPQLARLRMNGAIEVIGSDALRMTVEEAAGLARERGAVANAALVERLVATTRGWAAGLVLMLETGEAHDAPAPREGQPVSEVLFDYFAGEVFGRMAPRVQRLLSAVALMPDSTAAAAAELTGMADAGAVLEDLRRRNYFTTRDVEAEPRYRFHPLFRDFLIAGAKRLHPPGELAALKIKAAGILDSDGQPEPAAVLLDDAEAHAALGALIKRHAGRLIKNGRHDTVAAWLAKLPDALIEADGWLSHWRAYALMTTRSPVVLAGFRRAAALFKRTNEAGGEYLAWAGATAALNQDYFGDMTRYDALIAAMPELRARHPEFPSPEVELEVAHGMCLALARRGSDRAAFALWKQRAQAAALAAPLNRIGGHGLITMHDLHDANYAEARTAIDSLPDPLTLDHHPFAQTAGLLTRLIALCYRQIAGDCSAYAEETIRRIEAAGYPHWRALAAGLAQIDAVRRGDAGASGAWLRRAADYADEIGPHRGVHYHYSASRHYLLIGDVAGAKAHAEQALELAQGWRLYEALAGLARAEALAEGDDLDEAEAELDRLDDTLTRSHTRCAAFSAHLLRADLRFARNDTSAGLKRLAEAMTIGRRHDERRVALMQARASRLCGLALTHGTETDFVRGLIGYAEIPPADMDNEAWPWPLAIRTLGTFEVVKDGTPLAVSRKTPKRLITLVKAIAARGGTDAPEGQVVDAVWPDEDGDAGRQSFKVAIHRLRQLLGDAAAVTVKGGRVTLDPARCWLDIRAFERLTAPKAADESKAAFDARQTHALALYRGDFLAGEDDLYWAAPQRARLRARFVRAVCETAERRAERGECQDAVTIYRRAMEVAPDSEEICQALMRRCLAAGRGAEGRLAYERLRATLEDRSGAAPAPTTDTLHRKLATM